ncbi:MAG TPA: phosphate/phosphite/phosphonate ABC transporter substrate-binding protein [Anaeromyxobacteraceae bacterium]|nr:phosphate/phosphite/phosphonate ABC transporter substrate-binding protein [Anaeromyxobacteraceae bacterium]
MSRRLVLALFFGLLLAAPISAAAEANAQKPRILIGLIPELNIFKQKARFRLLGEYLTRKVGVPVEFTILSRYGNIIESFQTERMDGAFFGSFTGALALEKLGVIPLARPVNLDGSSTYHGHLFVRADSKIRTVKQLRGKRMAFVDRATTAGYVFPLALLREAGIRSPDGFFGEYYFTGSHDAAIAAVLERKADVGAAKHSVYDRIRKEDPRVDRELLIIAESPPFPSNGLCVRRDLNLVLQASLKQALLDLEKEPSGAQVLAQFGALRFIETTAEDYRPVIDVSREAGIDLKTYDYRNQ